MSCSDFYKYTILFIKVCKEGCINLNTYKNLSILNGVLLAIMIFFNGVLSQKIGLYLSTLIYHILGFLLISLVSVVNKNKFPELSKIPVTLFIPGILSVLIIFLVYIFFIFNRRISGHKHYIKWRII